MRRFKRSVPARQCSLFVQHLLEQALPRSDDEYNPLYQAALAVERDASLAAEMAGWERATIADGLRPVAAHKRSR